MIRTFFFETFEHVLKCLNMSTSSLNIGVNFVNHDINFKIYSKTNTSKAAHWITNPLRRMSEHNHRYNYLNF